MENPPKDIDVEKLSCGLCVESETLDPFFNMALEEVLYNELAPDKVVLFLYRNSGCIVVGRFQNPWAECDVPAAEHAGIPVLRRISGGGTVFHDEGNLNYSILTPRGYYDQALSFSVVLTALRRLGMNPEMRNKSDIFLDGFKISGNAFKVGSDRAMHHGTLLVRSDLPRLKRYLKPSLVPDESKAIQSRPSPVMNVSERLPALDTAGVVRELRLSFEDIYGLTGVEHLLLCEEDVHTREDVRTSAARFRDWDWVFGKTPDFSFTEEGRKVTVTSGLIKDRE